MSFRRSPAERREGRIEFLGEQDGPAERELKTLLRVECRRFPSIQRAYLARMGFTPDAPISVGLCIAPSSAEDPAIVEAVQRAFSSLFASDAHLDIVFVDAEQERDLQRVCQSFL
jgi:hypothetical protein